jgi:soluble epoxide hydrolase/lipid-phosphate phosphatase
MGLGRFGWRNQIPAWVHAGYRVIAPDMLGYGSTDKPADVSAYTTKNLSHDLAAILDLVGVERAVVIGHDWGSFLASRFALWYPNRLLGLAQCVRSVTVTGRGS